MSVSHLTELRTQLERRHWRIVTENKTKTTETSLNWRISRPNGDSPLTLEFTPGSFGPYGGYEHDSIEHSIACEVIDHPEIPYLYFGKFQGHYQDKVLEFVDAINSIG